MKAFEQKNVYLVGGSSGIGLAAGRELAKRGANILVMARRENLLKQAVETFQQHAASPDQKFDQIALDVSDPGKVNEAVSKGLEMIGPPHILINCAGRAYPHRFQDITFNQFDETMRVNLYGAWNLTAACLPHMEAGSYIVHTSSVAGLIGVFGYTDYCASKFAVIGFCEALRGELKPRNITVSVLCPPDTDTPGFETENTTKPEETKAISGSGGLMSADAVAQALLNGMAKESFLIVPGFQSRSGVLAKRIWPGLVQWIMDREVKKVQK
jgi:3-dehydrosphinganine reductase